MRVDVWLKNMLFYLMNENVSDDNRINEVVAVLWSIGCIGAPVCSEIPNLVRQ